MFRWMRDVIARPRDRAQDMAREVRAPDPYVWRLPDPYDARWRRWHKRCRAAGRYLPFPEGDGERPAATPPLWQGQDDDVVRPYVLRP